jgi:hypothetical protein
MKLISAQKSIYYLNPFHILIYIMALRPADVIFNDKPTKNNKDLINFLNGNLSDIIRKGRMRFRWRIAGPDTITQLRQEGVKALPALKIDKQYIIGVPAIVNYLRNAVRNSKAAAPTKTEDEVINDFFRKELGQTDEKGAIVPNDDGDEEQQQEDLIGKANREFQRRGLDKTGMPNAPPSKPSRTTVQDDDNYEAPRRPKAQKNRAPQRPDNVAAADDPLAALSNIQGRGGGGEAAQDDDMMRALLNRMDTSGGGF